MTIVIQLLLSLLMIFGVGTVHGQPVNFNVGMRQLSTSLQNNEVKMQMMVWYPTSEAAKTIKVGRFKMEVARDAKVKAGNRSLIAISHGSGGSHLGHRDTATYLASKGYIAVAVLHPRNNFMDNSEERKHKNWLNRPRHVSAAIDVILGHDDFKDVIDQDRIGIIGHSAGGYTALALIGGKPNSANISTHCREHEDDAKFCGRRTLLSAVLGYFSSQNASGEEIIEGTYDHRIKAAVLAAPLGVLFNDKDSLSKVNVPVRIYRAEDDKVLLYPYHAEAVRKKLPKKPEYVFVKNAGHYSFIAPFPDGAEDDVGEVAIDPEGFNRTDFHKKMNQEIAEFFSKSLLQ